MKQRREVVNPDVREEVVEVVPEVDVREEAIASSIVQVMCHSCR